jgi:hypothetical protein
MNIHGTKTPWDTTKIGFVTNFDPSFYTPEQAQMKFNALLKDKLKQMNTRTKTKIPHFRMIFSSPKMRNKETIISISTKAYAIEVKHEDSIQMLLVLKSLFRDTPTFVPFTMRTNSPKVSRRPSNSKHNSLLPTGPLSSNTCTQT